jgi:hypothetical protein
LGYFFGPAYSTPAAFFNASTTDPDRINTVVFVARRWPGDIAASRNAVTVVSSGASTMTKPSYSPNE